MPIRAHHADESARPAPARSDAPRPAGRVQELLALQRLAGNQAVGHHLSVQRESVQQAVASPARPIEPALRAEMESRLGADFSGVRLHDGPVAQRSATALSAAAYTSGRDIVVGPGGLSKLDLAHELTHVMQQAAGPVAGTDHGSGVRVSDPSDRHERAAEANAAKAMSGPVPAQRQAEPLAPGGAGEVVQRKGTEKLTAQVAAARTAAQGPMGWLSTRLTKPGPDEPAVAALKQAVAAYDAWPGRDPSECLQVLTSIMAEQAANENEFTTDAGRAYLESFKAAYRREAQVLGAQIKRAEDHPAEGAAPYEKMTTDGAMWKESAHHEDIGTFGMSGPSYFMELSAMNRGDMTSEIQPVSGSTWVKDVTQRLEAQLRSAVLSHYTLASRADAMEAGGNEIKSKTALAAENPTAAHNTQGTTRSPCPTRVSRSGSSSRPAAPASAGTPGSARTRTTPRPGRPGSNWTSSSPACWSPAG